MKNCGNCEYFTKHKNLEGCSGLCGAKDCRTFADAGHKCKDHKFKKYKRVREEVLRRERENKAAKIATANGLFPKPSKPTGRY